MDDASQDGLGADEILFEQRGCLGLITLNKPESLNALTYGMVKKMDVKLDEWERDDSIAVVAIQGAGDKAFAAGGDIRWLYENGQGGKTGERNFQFFADEYRLNAKIKLYPKPYVGIMDGIVMGGGVGVSIHGSFRVATERTMFAMPETGIGLFPDVGATFFLPRLPDHIGMWLGLTGARLKGADVLRAGLCDRVIKSSDIEALIDVLSDLRHPATLSREAIVNDPGGTDGLDYNLLHHIYCNPDGLTDDPPVLTRDQCKMIATDFQADSVEGVLSSLATSQTDWAMKQRKTILSKSPTSTRIAFRQIREGANLSFEDCMRLENRLARYCMTHPDFYEGTRAVIIDKDNAPQWSPATLDEATDDFVAEAFANLGDQELVLP